MLFSDRAHRLYDLWFIGDNSLALSYRKSFKKAKGDFYLKDSFEVTSFCSSKYSDANTNAISRLINIFAHAVNISKRMPKYIVVMLDGDLIDYLGFRGKGIAMFYGEWIEYLADQFNKMINMRKGFLPTKAKIDKDPFFYWINTPAHLGFSDEELLASECSNTILHSVMQTHSNMRSVKFKDFWDKEDFALVKYDRVTDPAGWNLYWKAIDSTIKFNINKRNAFIAKERYVKKNHME